MQSIRGQEKFQSVEGMEYDKNRIQKKHMKIYHHQLIYNFIYIIYKHTQNSTEYVYHESTSFEFF